MKLPIQRFTVKGYSMTPTLNPGQDILSFNWAYLGKKPEVGDIVIVKSEIVKRVQRIESDKIYLIGDNMEESTDSRHFGPINLNQILGKMVFSSENQ